MKLSLFYLVACVNEGAKKVTNGSLGYCHVTFSHQLTVQHGEPKSKDPQ